MKSLRHFWLSTWFDPFHICRRFIYNDIKKYRNFVKGLLLDLGCGEKPYQDLLRDRTKRHIGLDIPSRIKRSNIKEIQKTIDIYGSGFNLPFKNNSIDTVLCIEVLQHVEEPHQIFSEIGRVLKKGGTLLLIAPQSTHLHEIPYDFYRYTRYGLEYLCKKNNLDVIRLSTQGGLLATVGFEASVSLFNSLCIGKTGHMRRIVSSVILPVCALIQLVSLLFDKITYIPANTMNNFLVAKKL